MKMATLNDLIFNHSFTAPQILEWLRSIDFHTSLPIVRRQLADWSWRRNRDLAVAEDVIHRVEILFHTTTYNDLQIAAIIQNELMLLLILAEFNAFD